MTEQADSGTTCAFFDGFGTIGAALVLLTVLDAISGKFIAVGFSPDGTKIVTAERARANDRIHRVRPLQSTFGSDSCDYLTRGR